MSTNGMRIHNESHDKFFMIETGMSFVFWLSRKKTTTTHNSCQKYFFLYYLRQHNKLHYFEFMQFSNIQYNSMLCFAKVVATHYRVRLHLSNWIRKIRCIMMKDKTEFRKLPEYYPFFILPIIIIKWNQKKKNRKLEQQR